jgi:hypothetical protein
MANVFNIAKLGIAGGEIDLGADQFDCLLLVSTEITTLSTAQYDYDTVSAVLGDAGITEASDASYTTTTNGRRAITIEVETEDSANDEVDVNFTADGNGGIATWTSVDNETYTGMIIYKRSTALGSANDATAIPLCLCDLTSDVVTNGGDVTITFAGDTFMTISN